MRTEAFLHVDDLGRRWMAKRIDGEIELPERLPDEDPPPEDGGGEPIPEVEAA